MDKKNLQDEIYAWHRQNYPTDDIYSALLSVGEELGELMRAELKQQSHIRGTAKYWQEEKKKEAGDVLIGLLNVCGFLQIDIEETLKNTKLYISKFENTKIALLFVSMGLGKVIDKILGGRLISIVTEIGSVYRDVEFYCHINNFDPDEILTERWKTISQRDFIENPATGGRERE